MRKRKWITIDRRDTQEDTQTHIPIKGIASIDYAELSSSVSNGPTLTIKMQKPYGNAEHILTGKAAVEAYTILQQSIK